MIEVINLKKNYDKKVAVNNLNFQIQKGEIIGLLGPNGCGKTTTIAMILGLLKPTSGQVIINGKNIEKERIYLLNKMNLVKREEFEILKKMVQKLIIENGKLKNKTKIKQSPAKKKKKKKKRKKISKK